MYYNRNEKFAIHLNQKDNLRLEKVKLWLLRRFAKNRRKFDFILGRRKAWLITGE